MSFTPLAECARHITQELDLLPAEEQLHEFLSEHPEAAAGVLYQLDGFWGMDWLDTEHLRIEYRLWKERRIALRQSDLREKQREAGHRSKSHLKRGNSKPEASFDKKSSKARRKGA